MKKIKSYLEKLSKKQRIGVGLGLLLLIVLSIIIPTSFAVLEPIRSITITSSKTSYESKEAGSWQIEKSAKWVKKGIAEITFDVDTIQKINTKYTDILFVLDISGSMSGDKLDRVKSDTIDLVSTLLSNDKNRAGLITFDSTSEILSEFTNDKNSLIEKINSLSDSDTTNYYQAFVNVDTLLKNYMRESGKECIVLFLTDGYPNEDIPNEEAEYRYLKDAYPYVTINGVQYEMGSDILDPIKKVSDNQYIADMETLNNVLFDASVVPAIYENFEITDYIDTSYFYVESNDDIKVSEGKVTFDKDAQTINWKMDSLKSGSSAKMTINVKLKDEFIGQGGVYPTNTKEEIKSKLEDQVEYEVSTKTPVLADNYKVIYEGNVPGGCSVEGEIPNPENKSVFDVVEISDTEPTCEGYEFRGWEFATENVTKVNKDYFIMPESDVLLKATWGRISVEKSMDGTVSVIQTFYKMMKSLAVPDDEKSEFVTSSTGINFGIVPSDTNGKGVYQLSATKNEEYPILYYRGAVENNNVKFGGFCWKIVRTTETGGVKLIYNGEPDESGACTNTTGTSTQIGISTFNTSRTSPADVGYMYGNRSDYTYESQSKPSWYEHIGRNRLINYQLTSATYSNTNYYYGDTITWDEKTGKYILSNSDGSKVEKTMWNSSTYESLKGKYRCSSGDITTCSQIYYIADGTSSSAYYIKLLTGQTLEDVNTLNSGKDVVYENGVYTIQNPIEGKRSDWYTEYSKYKGNYVCPDGSVSCNAIWYVVSSNTTTMYYVEMTDGETYDSLYEETLNLPWIYGNDVEWDGSKYILKDTYQSSPFNWNNDYKTIATKYHYTCFSTSDNCTEVGYIHYFSSGFPIYHLKFKGGKKLEDAKNEMFTNTTDSTIKQMIDNWYQANMIDYTDKLEDTVWCNDRSIDRGPLKSKDEDSSITSVGSATNYTYFGADGRNVRTKAPSVECPREEDKFTVSGENGNGMLTYPAALLIADELTLAGHGWIGYSSSSYLYTNQDNWSLSSRYFSNDYAGGFYLYSSGALHGYSIDGAFGVRPAVSLAPGTIIASGDGSKTDPFTVDMSS